MRENIPILLWTFPFKSLLLFFVTLNVTLFLLNRILLFNEIYNQESLAAMEHAHVFETICQNHTIRAGLGERYIDICHSAQEYAQHYVFVLSLQQTVQQTYLCGNTPCLDTVEQFLEIITRSLAFTVCTVLVSVVVTLFVILRYIGLPNQNRCALHRRAVDLEQPLVANTVLQIDDRDDRDDHYHYHSGELYYKQKKL